MFRLAPVGMACVLALLIVSGCFANAIDQHTMTQAKEPVYCQGAEECGIKWDRALNYVSHHSGYRFQTMTDTFAQTPGPEGDRRIATILRREPVRDGRYRIGLQVACGSGFIADVFCKSRLLPYVVGFKQNVNAPIFSNAEGTADHSAAGTQTTNSGPARSKDQQHNPPLDRRANTDGGLRLRIVPVSPD